MSQTDRSVEGRCLCGTVRFQAALPVKWCAHCHCDYCRRASGAAWVTWFGLPPGAFRLVAGEEDLRWYPSSPGARRGFCGRCGSSLLFNADNAPGEIHVVRATVAEEIGQDPQIHIFCAEQVDWATPGDDLPRFQGFPAGPE